MHLGGPFGRTNCDGRISRSPSGAMFAEAARPAGTRSMRPYWPRGAPGIRSPGPRHAFGEPSAFTQVGTALRGTTSHAFAYRGFSFSRNPASTQ
jgi:hypothetical protein